MLTLTLHLAKDGVISYKTENDYVRMIGELLVNDAVTMPDFLRALLISDDEESVQLDACAIQTKEDVIIIKHLQNNNLPTISLPKERMLQILDIWEDFLVQKNATQWIFFKEEEFGLPSATDDLSKKWHEMEKRMAVLGQQKDKQKETE